MFQRDAAELLYVCVGLGLPGKIMSVAELEAGLKEMDLSNNNRQKLQQQMSRPPPTAAAAAAGGAPPQHLQQQQHPGAPGGPPINIPVRHQCIYALILLII